MDAASARSCRPCRVQARRRAAAVVAPDARPAPRGRAASCRSACRCSCSGPWRPPPSPRSSRSWASCSATAAAWTTRPRWRAITFSQESIVYDRNGSGAGALLPGRAARGRGRSTTSRPSSSMPRPRSRTRRSGPTPASTRWAWSRRPSTRSAATRAAPPRSPSSWCARSCCRESVIQNGSLAERKIKELIQSIRVTQAYAGPEGKQRDHHRLSQPELLRQQQLRREDRGAQLLRAHRQAAAQYDLKTT